MLLSAILRRAQAAPEHPALVRHGVVWPYGAWVQAVLAARPTLAALGWPAGGTVLLAVQDLAQAWVAALALHSLGYDTVSVPASGKLSTLPAGLVCGVVRAESETESAAVIAEWATAQGLPLHTRPPLPAPQTLPPLPPAAQWSAQGSALLPELRPELSGSHILMTSGTTGDFKMVRRRGAVDAATQPLRSAISGLTAESVVFAGSFALLTSGGFHWPYMTWGVGGTVVVHQAPEPHRALQARRFTHCFATPSTLAHLLQAPESEALYQPQMSVFVTGGGLPRVLAEAARARLTPQVFTVYASTEAQTVGVTPHTAEGDTQWHQIHPLRTVQVVDDAHQPLPPGAVGLVRVRMLDDLAGYYRDASASAEYFHDGWFYSGDLGTLDAEGRLALHGRTTDVINALGSKIATGPIEQQLRDQLGVQAVCLFSAPDAEGEAMHLVIETTRPVDAASFQRQLMPRLGAQFTRLHVHTLASFPRNHMGKVLRRQLQAELLGSATPPAR